MNPRAKLGRDIANTAFNQLWRLVSGPASLLLIPLYLDPLFQGYWYTIVSLSAMAVLVDLGFANIILNFAAHEFSRLRMTSDKRIEGDEDAIGELRSLFRFAFKWSLVANLVAFPIILVVGGAILAQGGNVEHWLLPWLLYMVGSTISFINSAVMSFLEGCGEIASIQLIRLWGSIVSTVFVVGGLLFGMGLYALVAALLASNLTLIGLTLITFRHALRQLFVRVDLVRRNWAKEVLPLLGKYAVSWASGYFIFQIYVPLIYVHHGAVEAGKTGITLALVTAAFTFANIWMYTATPQLNAHIAKKEWDKLDLLFGKRLLYSLLSMATISAGIVAAITLLPPSIVIVTRFLGWKSVVILLIGWNIQLWINSVAIYIRAHKEEPLMLSSVLVAVWVGTTTWILASTMPIDFFFLGFLSSFAWAAPTIWFIWNGQKKRLHGNIGSKTVSGILE